MNGTIIKRNQEQTEGSTSFRKTGRGVKRSLEERYASSSEDTSSTNDSSEEEMQPERKRNVPTFRVKLRDGTTMSRNDNAKAAPNGESFCYCKSTGSDGKWCIQCHTCERWFHGKCAVIPKEFNEILEEDGA
eukprot:gene20916-7789_t